MPNKHAVFVYGTLKQGFGNHEYFLKGQEFVGYGRTKDKMTMRDTGGFPVVFRENPASEVLGELYEVDDKTLAGLDALEGNGHMFERFQFTVEHLDGSVTEAWMYVGVPKYWERTMNRLGTVEAGQYGFNWRNSVRPV